MPEGTHDWLINFTSQDTSATTGVDKLLGKLEQLREAIGTTGADWDRLMTRGVPQQAAGGVTPITPTAPTIMPAEPATISARTLISGAGVQTTFGGLGPEAQAQIAAAIPGMESVTQTTQQATRATADWATTLRAAGASEEFVTRATERANEFAATGIRLKDAQSRAVRETTQSFLEEGEAIEKSGNWLMRYIERYLIRYFVVWQGMVALKMVIRDWIQSHEDLEIALFRVQTAMQTTMDTAQSYVATMGAAGVRTGVPMGTMAAGGLMLGPTMAEQAARFGQMTGQGAEKAIQFFDEIQRQTKITDEQLEMLMARMFLAWAKHGQVAIQNWREFVDEIPAGLGTMKQWDDAWARFEQTGVHAAQGIGAAWKDLLGVIGTTKPITDAEQAMEGLLRGWAARIEASKLPIEEQRRLRGQYAVETGYAPTVAGLYATADFERWLADRMEKERAEKEAGAHPKTEQWYKESWARGKTTTGEEYVTGFAGVMQRPEYEQLATRVTALQTEWETKGLVGTWQEKTYWVIDKMGGHLEKIGSYAEVAAIAVSEMNERAKSAVYNWPGGAPLIVMPGALDQVSAPAPRPWNQALVDSLINKGGGGGSTWQPQPIDWNNPWVIPPQYRVSGGSAPNMSTPSGPAVGVAPSGSSNPWLPTTIKTQVSLDGKKVGESTNQVLGDAYNQAARAIYGGGGGLVSP